MSAGVENEAVVARQLADPDSDLPPGARRMTQPERQERMEAICSALLKQVRRSASSAIASSVVSIILPGFSSAAFRTEKLQVASELAFAHPAA